MLYRSKVIATNVSLVNYKMAFLPLWCCGVLSNV